MHPKKMLRFKSVLTNGEIDVEIYGGRYNCGIDLPEGVVFSEDSNGNMYLNNKPAWVEIKAEEY